MKKLLIFVIFMQVMTLLHASGAPRVRNFSRNDYGAAPQNWDLVQDSLGRVYVGNGYGMLMFDGQRWLNFGLPNSTAVRALLVDESDGRIYAAGTEEVGYFLPDSLTGELRYTSLMPLFGDRAPFTEIWHIFRADGRIWFRSDNYLIEYDGEDMTINRADGRIASSAVIDGRIYLAFEDGGLQVFNGMHFERLRASLPGKKIVAILPGPGRFPIFATADDGLYILNDKGIEPLESEINGFLKENQVFCGAFRAGKYVFGTVNRGIVITDFMPGGAQYLNKGNGLQNNTVLGASFDRKGNLWLCLDNGLDYVLITSPISNLIGPSYDIGAGYSSLRRGKKILFGTNQGLYSARYPFDSSPDPMALRRELKGQIWSINEDFIGADTGLYVVEGDSYRRVDGLSGTYMARILDGDGTRAIASTYDGLYLLAKVAGRWTDLGRLQGYDDIGGRFVTEGNVIWLPHWRKGVYRLEFDGERIAGRVLYDEASGLPSRSNVSAMIYSGRVVFSTEAGFYVFDAAAKRFRPDEQLNGLFGTQPFGQVVLPGNGTQILATNYGLEIARGKALDSISLRPLADKVIPGYLNLNFLSPGELIVSNQDGFWCVDTENIAPVGHPSPYVSSVYANRDSLVFMARGSVAELELPYGLNSLRFNFAASDYDSPRAVEFSSMLENYDAGFSPFSAEASREYTRLSEGEYILRVRMRDSRGDISETSFPVRVTPPWYRSLPALILYVMAVALMSVGAFYVLRRRVRASRLRLEQRKDYEIAALKSEQLEQDIEHKSRELSATTMNLIRKNEIFQEIAGLIDRLTPDDPAALQRQLARLRKRIEENISHDDDQKDFIRNFDIVYQDYTKRLMARHPNLTASDKRMCCYIKMGLSSKEIAPLVNISFKSVEMARYRLRKKMNLPAETSLADYLATV